MLWIEGTVLSSTIPRSRPCMCSRGRLSGKREATVGPCAYANPSHMHAARHYVCLLLPTQSPTPFPQICQNIVILWCKEHIWIKWISTIIYRKDGLFYGVKETLQRNNQRYFSGYFTNINQTVFWFYFLLVICRHNHVLQGQFDGFRDGIICTRSYFMHAYV